MLNLFSIPITITHRKEIRLMQALTVQTSRLVVTVLMEDTHNYTSSCQAFHIVL